MKLAERAIVNVKRDGMGSLPEASEWFMSVRNIVDPGSHAGEILLRPCIDEVRARGCSEDVGCTFNVLTLLLVRTARVPRARVSYLVE